MFYGQLLKSNTAVKLSKDGELLHLSQVCLNNPKVNGKTYIQVVDGNNSYNIACLEKDKTEQATIDIFIPTLKDMKIKTIGAANDVDVVGFFEPESSLTDDIMDTPNGDFSKKRQAPPTASNKNKAPKVSENEKAELLKKLSSHAEFDEDDDEDEEDEEYEDSENFDNGDSGILDLQADEDDEDDDDEDEDDDQLDNDDEDDDDEDEDELDEKDEDDDDEDDDDEADDDEADDDDEDDDGEENDTVKKEIASIAKSKGKKTQTQAPQQKQKIQEKNKIGNQNGKAIVSNDADTKFVNSLKQYLKENGKTNIGLLGNKVKKPAEVKEKLGALLKARSGIFKVENEMVSLIA